MRSLVLILAALSAAPTEAQTYRCTGQSPRWQLEFDQASARFVFPAPTMMDVRLVTRAEGREWPRAYTLVGERDTAIALLAQDQSSDARFHVVHVLTQRARTPILLTGRCTGVE